MTMLVMVAMAHCPLRIWGKWHFRVRLNALAADADILEGAAYDDGFSDTADVDDDFADNGIARSGFQWNGIFMLSGRWNGLLPPWEALLGRPRLSFLQLTAQV